MPQPPAVREDATGPSREIRPRQRPGRRVAAERGRLPHQPDEGAYMMAHFSDPRAENFTAAMMREVRASSTIEWR